MTNDKSMKAMLERHEKEKDDFQNQCSHPRRTKWLQSYWAPGHASGYQIRQCMRCYKELDRLVCCSACGKEMTGYQWHVGDGSSFACVGGGVYCDDCWHPAKKLTPKQRDEIQTTEWGTFIPNRLVVKQLKEWKEDAFPFSKEPLSSYYLVGDVITNKFLEAGLHPRIIVIDGKTKRTKNIPDTSLFPATALPNDLPFVKGKGKYNRSVYKVLNVLNNPGTLCHDLVESCRKSIKGKGKYLIHVEGEEDLAFIPLAMFAPIGATIIFGQPPVNGAKAGIVVVPVDRELKTAVKKIYDGMAQEQSWEFDEMRRRH